MYIFLGIVLELATIIGTLAYNAKTIMDSTLIIPEHGYRIDYMTLRNLNAKPYTKSQKLRKALGKALGAVLTLVPIINLLFVFINGVIIKRKALAELNNPEYQDLFIPMTEEEKERYARMSSKTERLLFARNSIGESLERIEKRRNSNVRDAVVQCESEETKDAIGVDKMEDKGIAPELMPVDGEENSTDGIPNMSATESTLERKDESEEEPTTLGLAKVKRYIPY